MSERSKAQARWSATTRRRARASQLASAAAASLLRQRSTRWSGTPIASAKRLAEPKQTQTQQPTKQRQKSIATRTRQQKKVKARARAECEGRQEPVSAESPRGDTTCPRCARTASSPRRAPAHFAANNASCQMKLNGCNSHLVLQMNQSRAAGFDTKIAEKHRLTERRLVQRCAPAITRRK
mgnify:CR=1 FL=1